MKSGHVGIVEGVIGNEGEGIGRLSVSVAGPDLIVVGNPPLVGDDVALGQFALTRDKCRELVALLKSAMPMPPIAVPEAEWFPELTPREREVALSIAVGSTNRDIAKVFDLSIKTVDTHRGHIMKKLELRNNVDLARLAIQRGYVTVLVG